MTYKLRDKNFANLAGKYKYISFKKTFKSGDLCKLCIYRWIKLKKNRHYKKINVVKVKSNGKWNSFKVLKYYYIKRINKKKTKTYEKKKVKDIINNKIVKKNIEKPTNYYSISYHIIQSPNFTLVEPIYKKFFKNTVYKSINLLDEITLINFDKFLYWDDSIIRNIYKDIHLNYRMFLLHDYIGFGNEINSINYSYNFSNNEYNLNNFIWLMVKYETLLYYLIEDFFNIFNKYAKSILRKLLDHLRLFGLGLSFYNCLTKRVNYLKMNSLKLIKCNFYIIKIEKLMIKSLNYLEKYSNFLIKKYDKDNIYV